MPTPLMRACTSISDGSLSKICPEEEEEEPAHEQFTEVRRRAIGAKSERLFMRFSKEEYPFFGRNGLPPQKLLSLRKLCGELRRAH